MALGLGSILQVGQGALNASQMGIQTTGNNIANVNTVGYSRQGVGLVERNSLNAAAGQIGQGVRATQIFRHFDRFIEKSYLEKNSSQSRYETEYSRLTTVESMFNESLTSGIGGALSNLFSSFNKLSLEPDNLAVRESLIQQAITLSSTIKSTQESLEAYRLQMDSLIKQDVDKANGLIGQIAYLNREINASTVSGRNNANALMDERDLKVRELSAILDISIQDDGAGNYNVSTAMGYALVQGDVAFSLAFSGRQVDAVLGTDSQYKGSMGFEGSDGYEYTVEVVNGGIVDITGSVNGLPGTAQYRVSLDGGKTWMTNDDGSVRLFNATDKAHSTGVKDLDLYFTSTDTPLSAGDRFVISPKNDVYWVEPTSDPINISSQMYSDGTENNLRITGGSLGGNLVFRDYQIGEYMDRLDALASNVIWEVNRIHSQGVGLDKMTVANGGERVGRTDIPLGSLSSQFAWSDKLQSGNMSFAIYDSITGEAVIPYPGIDVFSPENFDPAKHSLDDIVNAINTGKTGEWMTASVIDGRLSITAKQGFEFGVVGDTTGLLAGLGINTFFTGNDALSMAVRGDLTTDPNLINAGRINGAGEGNEGDNLTASELASLATKAVHIQTFGARGGSQTLVDYYAALVARVGSDTAGAKYSHAVESTMAQEFSDRREEISGVSLDEEMTNLIKFQSSYKAAAKLITTADEMLQVLLGLKQ